MDLGRAYSACFTPGAGVAEGATDSHRKAELLTGAEERKIYEQEENGARVERTTYDDPKTKTHSMHRKVRRKGLQSQQFVPICNGAYP